jgi:hypothetical protein
MKVTITSFLVNANQQAQKACVEESLGYQV